MADFSVTGTELYSQFIHLSRYARWLPEEGRRETWDETVSRYINFMRERFPDIDEETFSYLKEQIKTFNVMPSMRALMTAGKALERDNAAGYNCLSGNTLVTTWEYGITEIKNLVGKEVHVVDGNGDWVLAPCKSYGVQNLMDINISRSGTGKDFVIQATPDHTWILQDGERKNTNELCRGDKLQRISNTDRPVVDNGSDSYRQGVVHGIVYGDGTRRMKQSSGVSPKVSVPQRVCEGFAIRLCSDVDDLLPYFSGYSRSYPPSFGGDPVVYMTDVAVDLKSLPDIDLEFFNDDYLTGFVRGWLAADGSVGKDKSVSLATNKEGLDWILKVGPRLGFFVGNQREFPNKTNLGYRKETLYHIRLDRRTMSKDDFIIERKKERFRDCTQYGFGKISKVETTDVYEEVYCFEVPTTHSFLLTNNIITGNCSFVAIDSPRAFDEICYCLLCGTGVGFSVERQYVNKLPEVAEEFFESDTVIVVPDSKIGWAKSFRELISLCYLGHIPKWDLSKLRPAGAPLKTFGGRSSGKWPLNDLFEFTVSLFKKAAGRKLSSLECHDLVCKIAEIVVVGGTRRCLPENSTVFTPSGPKYIQDVKAGDVVVTGGETGEIVASGPSGKKKTIVINHRFGSLECTPEHRVAVFNSIMKYEFKRASDVVEGDRLVWDTVGYDGVHTELPFFDEEFHFNAKEFRIPELDEEVAWLFGLIHGDGYVGSKGVEIAGNSKQISFLARASMIFETKFGVSAPYGPDGRAGAGTRLRANSSGLGRWFLKNLKNPNESIQIPDFIMNATRSIRSAYLAGLLDAGGRVRKQDECIDQACTIYESFASDLVTLLAGLGIAGFVSKISGSVKRSKGVNCKDAYNIQIRGNVNRKIFYDEVGLYSCKLRERTLGFSSSVDFSFPVRWAGGIEGYGPRGNITVTSMRYDLPLLPTRVVSIEEGQEVETYDIQVSGLERFTTNGLVVHNSALLSLSNLSDDRMRTAKSGQWWVEDKQRALANNSAAYTEKPEFDVFLKEWMSLYESKSGERGIFSRVAADKKVRSTGRREAGHEWGTNPCLPRSAVVITPTGIQTFGDIEEGSVIWSGTQWTTVVDKWRTGTKPVYKYVTRAGTFVGTENHKVVQDGEKVEVKDAENIDVCKGPFNSREKLSPQDIMDGLVLGDGSVYKSSSNLVYLHIGEKDHDYFDSEVSGLIKKHRPGIKHTAYEVETSLCSEDVPKTYDRTVPDKFFYGSSDKVKGFLRGLYSANGCVIKSFSHSGRVSLKASSFDVVERVQIMLSSIGIQSYYTVNKPTKVKFSNGEYECKQSYDLSISSDRYLFRKIIGFLQNYKNEKLDSVCPEIPSKFANGRSKKSYDIVSVEYIGDETVYDITVDSPEHTYWNAGLLVSNCGEIILRPNEFCNLSEVIVRPDDTLESLKEKVKSATILGTFQSTLTDFRYLRKAWKKNVEEERLLGVSITGVMDHKVLGDHKNKDLPNWLSELRSVAVEENKKWAEKLGINQSVSVTTQKPSGTCSQLCNTSSGIHPRYSPYYVRTVRADGKDPLAQLMIDQGFPYEIDVMNDKNYVFSFPVKSPDHSKTTEDISAMDQLKLWLVYQEYWCEHNPSCTIYYRDDEFLELGSFVWNNFDKITGVSFLPHSDHVYKQAPYQPITKEEYEKLLSEFPSEVNWDVLGEYESEDNTAGSQTLACSGGVCEVVDLTEK